MNVFKYGDKGYILSVVVCARPRTESKDDRDVIVSFTAY